MFPNFDDKNCNQDPIPFWPSFLRRFVQRFFFKKEASKEMIALADQAVISGSNFLSSIIIGRACTKEEFGLYALGFSIILFAMNLQTSLILDPYSVFSARLKNMKLLEFTGSTLIHQFGIAVLSTAFLIVWGILPNTGIGPKDLTTVIWALAATIALILFKEYARKVCFANLRVGMAFTIDLLAGILQVSGLLMVAQRGILSASHAYFVVGFSCLLCAGGWFIYVRNIFAIRFNRAIKDFGNNWAFGRWLLGYSLTYTASMQLYPWLLASFHGSAATGILAASMGVIFLANPFLMGMGNFLGPQMAHAFAKGGVKEVHRFVVKGTHLFLLVMLPFCILMFCLGGAILKFMYGDKYSSYGGVVAVLALSQLASALTFPLNYGLSAMERPDAGFKSYVLSLFVMLTFGLWLVKSFGPIGAAYSLLAANVTASIFRWIVYRRVVTVVGGSKVS